MKIGMIGTGMVGATIGTRLVELGHDVKMGSRSANSDKAVAWAKAGVISKARAPAARRNKGSAKAWLI